MIDLDALRLRLMALACVVLAVGWGLTVWHTRRLLLVTETAQAGWGACVNHALVKLDDLESRRRQNVRALMFGNREIEP